MPRIKDRLALANEIIQKVVPQVRELGQRTPHAATAPGCLTLELAGLTIQLAEQILLLPSDKALSALLDIWPLGGKKVLSIRWVPERPWEPPQIVCLKPGDWIGALGIECDS